MIILFQIILFSKEFFACNGYFGLFTKIKEGSGTRFWCTFSAWFFDNGVPYLILFLWAKFKCHTFLPSQDIKQNVLLSSYLDKWWHQTLIRFIFNHPLNQWLTEGKRGEDGNKKFEYLENQKSFFNEIKSIFHIFWRTIICWKKKKKKKFVKIADTNFKCTTKSFSSHPFTIASVHLVLFCLCLFGCFVFFAFLFHLFFSLSLILIIGIFYCLNYILLLLSLQCTLYHIYLFHLSFSLSLQ